MNKKKGFTLIELLAIIVILAIIAVITVPIILNIIEESKKGAAKDSAYGYKDSVNKYYTQQLLNNKNLKLNDTYTVTNGTLSGGDFGDSNVTSLPIQVSGIVPTSGSLTYSNNNLTEGCLVVGEYAVTFSDEKISNITKGECAIPPSIKYASLIVTSGDGLYESETEPGRLIYRGANPDNRIFLKEDGTNNTLYRIISYETDGTIKVIRDASIGLKSFDEQDSSDTTTGPRHNSDNTFCNYSGTYYGCNVWGNMNNTYYNGQTLSPSFKYRYYSDNSTEILQEHSDTGTVNTDSTLNQYLNGTWLTSALSNYIDNHNFDVGGVYYYNSYTGGDKGITREKEEESLYTWNGKIGLMNITEYVETSTNPECTSVYSNYYFNTNYYYGSSQHISGYDNWPCSNRAYNWLPKRIIEWSLSPYSYNRRSVWYVDSTGYFGYDIASNARGVRPAFYLKAGINLTGSGAENDEYEIN